MKGVWIINFKDKPLICHSENEFNFYKAWMDATKVEYEEIV